MSKVRDVVCPGGDSSLPDGSTCCQLASGQFGCCPQPKAVCCSDHVHCCPTGYTCDVSAGTCSKGNLVQMWEKKTEAKKVAVKEVVCPAGTYTCPDGSTCCQLASGAWGCCPQLNAVCCSDHVHCCPTGYTCDVSAGTCSKGRLTLPWEEKTVAKKIVSEVRDVVCPGGDSSCPDGSTCCQLASGQFGCCPQPKAVCCSDHVHCCPTGYKCDVSAGTCSKGRLTLPWEEKTVAKKIVSEVRDVV